MLRGLICSAAVVLAVIVQLTIINRVAFPGGTGPDLVLLAVAALALANGPLAGSLIGFCAGLALDVAPPGSHFVGQDALVFCLIGYACGLVADEPSSDGVPDQGHTALFEITVTAVAAVFGEALSSLLGAMLSDPRVTWAAITHVLPIAVIYDLLLCPFVLLAVAAALRLAGGARRSRTSGQQPRRAVASSSGLAQVTPRLRLSEHGHGAMSGAGALSPVLRIARNKSNASGSANCSPMKDDTNLPPRISPRDSILRSSISKSRHAGASGSRAAMSRNTTPQRASSCLANAAALPSGAASV